MALFKPTKYIIKADEITPLWCNENNVKGIILDTDNTLSVHGSQMPADGILSWIDSLKKSGIRLVILSNNTKQRIEPFAKILDIPFVVNGAKPLKTGFKACFNILKLKKEEIIIIGDQIFTDILGGNRFKIRTILCSPIQLESGFFFKVKRKAEKLFFKI